VGKSFQLGLNTESLSKRKKDFGEYSIAELKEYLVYLEHLGYRESHYKTALYSKYAQPLIPIIMMMLAMPMGFQFGRRGVFYGVAAGLGAGLVFYGLFELFKGFGSSGLLTPLSAGWAVVSVFGFIALYRFINLE